jgi:predicted nucleic acid-binding protein
MRVVLDTNQIVAAGTRWLTTVSPTPNTLAQRLVAHVADYHTGLLCGEIAGEYVAKLIDYGHPKSRIIVFFGWLIGAFERVTIVSTTCNPRPADGDDTIFLLCAIDGQAHLLVTEDGHLLALAPAYNAPRILNRASAAPQLGVPA